MSYEGHTQHWCPNGHYWTEEEHYGEVPKGFGVCPHCGSECVFENSVDDTNYDSYGHIKPVLVSDRVMKNCPCCGQTRMVKPPKYEIPTAETPRLRWQTFDTNLRPLPEGKWEPV